MLFSGMTTMELKVLERRKQLVNSGRIRLFSLKFTAAETFS